MISMELMHILAPPKDCGWILNQDWTHSFKKKAFKALLDYRIELFSKIYKERINDTNGRCCSTNKRL